MFGLFKKDPIEKLSKEHEKILEKALQAQRNGNIELFSKLSFDAQKVLEQIEKLEKELK